MKKVSAILLTLALAFACFAGGLSAPTIYGPTKWEADTGWNSTAADTLYGADTLTILTKYRFDPGYEYALRMKVSTPAGDSLQFEYLSYGTDRSTLFEQAMFDTCVASQTTRTAVLPIGKTVLCNYATIRAIGWTSAKKRTFSRVELWRRSLGK